MTEPELDVRDIQGHVFPGFGTAHSVVIALRLSAPTEGRAALARLLPEVTTMSSSLGEKDARRAAAIHAAPPPQQEKASLALSFAATALRAWGFDTGTFDPFFQRGMRADAGDLGDPLDEDKLPVEWTIDRNDDNRVDVLIVAGHSEWADLDAAVTRWLSMITPHLVPVLVEYGRRRPDDQEFFGFNDGVSQPALRGVTPEGKFVSRRVIDQADSRSNVFAKPGHLLIWPGAFIFGYPSQTSTLTEPGATMPPPVPWMHNGSYLVFRRLLQNVRAFREAVAQLEAHLTAQGEIIPEGWMASRLVGRWPDGTPVSVSPNEPDPAIGDDPLRANNFRFLAASDPIPLSGTGEPPRTLPGVPADAIGLTCPRVSHIRKVNPRDGTSEIGSENHPTKLVLRRGITFGPEEDIAPEADRGLMFLSYQTSIAEQFRFLQINWANSSERPTGDGRDPIIGQDGTNDVQRRLRIFGPSRRQIRCPFNGRWVMATGGGYFVAPGFAGLRYLLGAD